VRMVHLAVVGSCSVNGVARIHSELLKNEILRDFAEFWPFKFNNKTNGITPRRWLLSANPAMAQLITEVLGDGWITELDELQRLEPLRHHGGFPPRVPRATQNNKKSP